MKRQLSSQMNSDTKKTKFPTILDEITIEIIEALSKDVGIESITSL
jgi:hypothetical protein